MNPGSARRRFSSFDGSCVETVDFRETDRYRDLRAWIARGPVIARGAGLSYVAAGFGGGAASLGMRRFDRILAWDSGTGIVRVEAGCAVGVLERFLATKGRRLAVVPGYPEVTVGGCVAADVHGKDQYRRGNFGRWVAAIRLLHPAQGEFVCRPGEAAFEATIGGLGLTGIVLDVEIRTLVRQGGAAVVTRTPVSGFAEAIDALGARAGSADALYVWLDLCDPAAVEGLCVEGRIVEADAASSAPAPVLGRNGRRALPVDVLSRPALRGIARLFRARNPVGEDPRRIPLYDLAFPAVGSERYFSLFGPRGFREMQCLVPKDAATAYFADFGALLRRARPRVALATLKLFAGRQRYLRFDGDGYAFALDLPRACADAAFEADLNALNAAHGCVPALIKDSAIDARAARAAFPEFDAFRALVRRDDPGRAFRSALSERIGL